MVSTGIYVRVSTEEQAREGYSIRAQEEKLRSYAMLKDWNIYKLYADEGISGKNIEGRPAVMEMIADVTSGKINNVLVYKIDRLTRSTKNLIELVDLFNQYHCAFNSLVESIDTASATGRMFLKIVGIFAEFERENLAERVRLGKERKVKEGYSICSFIQSYGYERETGQNNQVILPSEASIVRRIFNMYLYGDYSLKKIAQILNAENVPTKRGSRWLGCTVKVILMNPTYIGKVRYGMSDSARYFEAEGKHEAIIDEITFYQAQEKLSRIKKLARTKRPSSAVYFCGVLYCFVCGGRMTTKWNYTTRDKTKKTYPNYICSNVIRGLCASGTMSHAKVERAFDEYMSRIEDFSEIDNVDIPDNEPEINNSAEIKAIITEIARTEKKNDEIMSLFVSNVIDFNNYQGMTKLNNQRRGELQARLNLLQNAESTNGYCYTADDIPANIRDNWRILDDGQRLQFVQKFIDKILVHSQSRDSNKRNIIIIDEVVFNVF